MTPVLLQSLGAALVLNTSTEAILRTAAELAGTLPGGAEEASALLLSEGRRLHAVVTGPHAARLEENQQASGDGPGRAADSTGVPVEISDARSDRRWRQYAACAVQLGQLSSLSMPLRPGVGMSGWLTAYWPVAGAVTDPRRALLERLADLAARRIRELVSYHQARDLAARLEDGLRSRTAIEQAKGILMERHKLTSQQAFDLLARRAAHTNRTVRDVAEQLSLTRALSAPGGPDAFGRRPMPTRQAGPGGRLSPA